ncbi:MAG TPA: mechanosensitive ion channel family protein [Nitrososphaeraceae archaeon]|nr:mechanosensitive ion channel family protein [Nitrososphaeraceae archaeon]
MVSIYLEKQYFILHNSFTLLSLLLIITVCTTFEDLIVLAQEDLDILVNEDQQTGENNEDTTSINNNEDSQNEDKPIRLTTEVSSESENFWSNIIILITGIGVAVSLYFLIKHLIKRATDSLGLDKRQLKGINSITKLVIIVITITIILFQFSSISGVAAGAISVAAGTIIGFSSRNTISNAIAGILLLSSRPFKLGDRIRTTEDETLVGDVVEITLLYTKIKTVRNELVTIPNQTLLQRQIVNYSGLDVLAITVEISMTYNNKRKLIEQLLIESAKVTEGIITSPSSSSSLYTTISLSSSSSSLSKEPYVILKNFSDYGAIYELRAYTNRPNEYQKLQSEIRKNVYDTFQNHGLDLTIPQAQSQVDLVKNYLNETTGTDQL